MVPKDVKWTPIDIDTDHGHEVAEPDEDHEDPAGETLAAVHAVSPLLDLASKRGCNIEHGTLVIRLTVSVKLREDPFTALVMTCQLTA